MTGHWFENFLSKDSVEKKFFFLRKVLPLQLFCQLVTISRCKICILKNGKRNKHAKFHFSLFDPFLYITLERHPRNAVLPLFQSLFCLVWVLPLQFSSDFHLHGISFFRSLNIVLSSEHLDSISISWRLNILYYLNNYSHQWRYCILKKNSEDCYFYFYTFKICLYFLYIFQNVFIYLIS